MTASTHRRHDLVFKAIDDPTRREILGVLAGGRRTVGEIARNFRTSLLSYFRKVLWSFLKCRLSMCRYTVPVLLLWILLYYCPIGL